MPSTMKVIATDNGPLETILAKYQRFAGFGAGNKGLLQNIVLNRISFTCGRLYIQSTVIERYGIEADLINVSKLYGAGLIARRPNGLLFVTQNGAALLRYIYRVDIELPKKAFANG